jgi:transcriptional regulator with XRE-family HTH domain
MRKEEQAVAATFGERLRVVRKQRGMSQDDLARRVDVHITAIARFERGAREPRLASIQRLAAGLGVHPGALLPTGKNGVVPAGIVDVLHEMVQGGHGAAIVAALRDREEFERRRAIESDDREQRRTARRNLRRIAAFLESAGVGSPDAG